jgi:hypothetical protein
MAFKQCDHEEWLDSGMCLTCPPTDSWQHHAECIKYPPDTMFPENEEPHLYERARRICEDCPVIGICLEIGLEDKWGMWGGLDPVSRYKLAKSGKLPKDRLERRKYLRIYGYTS